MAIDRVNTATISRSWSKHHREAKLMTDEAVHHERLGGMEKPD